MEEERTDEDREEAEDAEDAEETEEAEDTEEAQEAERAEETQYTPYTPPGRWADHAAHPEESVFIETGRGQAVEVQVGAPFAETIEHLADEAHYGGFFRVFLNGEELIEPKESPTTIEPRMRIVITSYDKVAI